MLRIRFRIPDFGLWIGGAAAMLFAACSSGGDAGPTPKVASAVSERDVVEGKALLTSTVKVTFDRDFEVVESTLPFASLFEFSVPLAEGGSKRVLVKTAERSEINTRLVTLTVGALVPDGSTLSIQKKAFQRNASGAIEREVTGELDPALVVLASQAMAITDPAYFDEPETAAVRDADRDPAAMRAALEAHLEQRGSDAPTTAEALRAFDEMSADVIPSPKLRAALAALTGTFAEPAIQSLLTADNCTERPASTVTFQVPPGNEKLLARVTYAARGARVVSINPYAEGERIEHLMPILAHEAVHCDRDDGLVEEVAATAFDGFLYLQLVAVNPELAKVRTRVARELNIDAVAMINSGQRYPESIGVLQSPGVTTVLPLTNTQVGSFAEFVAAAYPQITQTNSASENIAQAYADRLAEASGTDMGQAFDLRYLDELISRSTSPALLAAAIIAFELTPAS